MIGDRARFGVLVGPTEVGHAQLRSVKIYVGGENLTFQDDEVYVPNFLLRVELTLRALDDWPDLAPHTALLGSDPWALHERLVAESEHDQVLASWEERLSFLEWGEITFPFCSFLFRFGDRMWLTARHREGELKVVEVGPAGLRDVVERAYRVVADDYADYRKRAGLD
ncbi:hypothetical protein FHS29_006275 [Saccharothrix tamanrassetensis]|uniref:Uncharacterized protein n=1 Tax=Saccharothrix tamanrassetensis TaxID=1051531 RepID=A0A841CTL3_9PSEU|nr:hypothetical protein [Saccharothrix tamanrassetensis]MBB5959654.1 hypothetical protein [Saccharothrix tamanrassetensis]